MKFFAPRLTSAGMFLTAVGTAAVMLAGVPASALAADPEPPQAAPFSAVAEPSEDDGMVTSQEERDLAAAVVEHPLGPELMDHTDCGFVTAIYEHVRSNERRREVRAAAAAASTTRGEACPSFIVTGIHEAKVLDAQQNARDDEDERQRRETRTKAAQALDIVIDSMDHPLLRGSDQDFAAQIHHRLVGTDWNEARAAAHAAFVGSAKEQQDFIASGLADAAHRDRLARIEVGDRVEVERTHKRNAAERIALPVNDELLNLPYDSFIRRVLAHNDAGRNVKLDAVTALSSVDPTVWEAFVATGIHAASKRDLLEQLAKQAASDRKVVQEILARATAAGERNKEAAAREALDGGTAAVAAFLANGQYHIAVDLPDMFRNGYSGQCLTTKRTPYGLAMVQRPCAPGKAYGWKVLPRSQGRVEIRNAQTGTCLAISPKVTAENAPAIQAKCNGAANALWVISTTNVGSVKLKNHMSAKCLSIPAGNKNSGARVVQKTCTDHKERTFYAHGRGFTEIKSGRLNSDRHVDLLAVDGFTGKLFFYPGTAGRSFGARVEVGRAGWTGRTNLTVGEFNRDAHNDLLAVNRRTGELSLLPGKGDGTFGTWVQLAPSGWNSLSDLTAGKFNAGEFADLLAVEIKTGKLFLYPGTAAGRFGPRVQISTWSGWNGFDKFVAGRFDGDAHDDLMVVNATGQLLLSRGNGAGRTFGSPQVVIPNGWNGMSQLVAGRFDYDDKDDVVAVQNGTGKLVRYPGRSGKILGPRVEMAIGQ